MVRKYEAGTIDESPRVCTVLISFIFIVLFTASLQAQEDESTVLAKIRAKIIPNEGQQTAYGIPLFLHNTREFLNYDEKIKLTSVQSNIMNEALSRFAAPCCQEFSIATCCCPCNLAKSVWGLSKYLITEKNYDVDRVAESALEWLRFTRSDFYLIEELQNRDTSPLPPNLKPEDSCFVGKCEFSFTDRGCGGMKRLRM